LKGDFRCIRLFRAFDPAVEMNHQFSQGHDFAANFPPEMMASAVQLPGLVRTRQSCDRCHSQKNKCPKQEGSLVCKRCAKAGAVCTFSPPGSKSDGTAAVAAWLQPSRPPKRKAPAPGVGDRLESELHGAEPADDGGDDGDDGEVQADLNGQAEAPIASSSSAVPASLDWYHLAFDEGKGLRGGTPSIFGDLPPLSENWPNVSSPPLFQFGALPSTGGQASTARPEPHHPQTQKLPPPPPLPPPPQQQPQQQQQPPRAPVDSPKLRCTRQLAAIMLDLEWMLAAIPKQEDMHVPSDDHFSKAQAVFAQKFADHNIMELLLSATQRLYEAYPAATALSMGQDNMAKANNEEPDRNAECQVENCIHALRLPENMAAMEQAADGRANASAVDQGLASVLMGAHYRLLDVLDGLTLMVVQCMKVTLAGASPEEPDFMVPVLKVGSFEPPKSAAVFMQAFLLKHFLGILDERVGKLKTRLAEKMSQLSGCDEKKLRVLELQIEILWERHAEAGRNITTISDEAVKIGMLK
jgi:hypothetical protein